MVHVGTRRMREESAEAFRDSRRWGGIRIMNLLKQIFTINNLVAWFVINMFVLGTVGSWIFFNVKVLGADTEITTLDEDAVRDALKKRR
jgi:hypothetical protein